MRPEKFAAFVTVAGPGGIWLKSAPQKSVWISFGKNDKIVPYKIQKFSSKQYLKFFETNENTAQTNGEITSYETSENKEIIIEDQKCRTRISTKFHSQNGRIFETEIIDDL